MTVAIQGDLLNDRPQWIEEMRQGVKRWAERGVFFGGSSWKYQGWLSQVYSADRYQSRGRFSVKQFERHCLEEYAEWFGTVCGDFSFYDFYSKQYWAELFNQVPSSFQFGLKVPEQITCPVFPKHARYGPRAGQPNEHFLDADLVTRDFIERLAPYRQQIGYVIFEFPQFHKTALESNSTFLQQLDSFLARLPKVLPYSVEIRTGKLLGDDYLSVLRRNGASHCFNSWTRMPSIGEQLQLPGVFTADFSVARLLLRPRRTYEQAVAMFEPYKEVQDPYPDGYRDAAELVRAAKRDLPTRRVFLAVNNRFVGNTPGAIAAILDELSE